MFRFATGGSSATTLRGHVALAAFLLAVDILRAQQTPAPAQSPAAQPLEDWQGEVRAQLHAGKPEEALKIAERRLEFAPHDLEARAWRGRVLARLGRLSEAEAEFRGVAAKVPNDTDVLLDLASVLRREGRLQDALDTLDRARALDPRRGDVALERGRVLRSLGREPEARQAFREAARLSPDDAEVKEALNSSQEQPRHELRAGTDIDQFNYTDTAGAFTLGWTAKWSPRWVSSYNLTYYDRFGGQAVRNEMSAVFKPWQRTGITAGGAWNHDDNVIARSEAFFELDQGGRAPRTKLGARV